MMNVLMSVLLTAQYKARRFFKKEDGEVNIIAIIVLIGIAILLALIFKDRIAELINNLFDTINQNAENAVNYVVIQDMVHLKA